MKELSLFSGAGGGLLGTLLLGWRHIGYVEFNDYCQRVIAQRIADGILPAAPIFGDVREFVQSGAAREYRGFADVVTGGFPCQPFSVAGRRAGADDERNMWPATLDTVRAVRPRYCFFENVPGLLASGYFERILCDLTESGYSVRWRCLSAAELGAPHRRDRLWIVAHAKHDGHLAPKVAGSIAQGSNGDAPRQETTREFEGCSKQRADVAHTESQQAVGVQQQGLCGDDLCDTAGKRRPRTPDSTRQARRPGLKSTTWWEAEPRLGRLADGVPDRINRLKAAGNAQVPIVAATAWHLLTEDL